MVIKKLVIVALLSVAAVSTHAQTSRQYFSELRDANAFKTYKDKYVCFRDDDVPSFAVVAAAEDVIDEMIRAGQKEGAKTVAKANGGLFVQTYYKGVASGDVVLYEKTEDGYRLDASSAPTHHYRTVYMINWKTGRYRLQVYATDYNKDLPAAETSGKCELIDPSDTPSVLGDRRP